MKSGDIVLLRFPQADLAEGKLRPALVVALAPGRHPDLLLALITSRMYQEIPDFDEVIEPSDSDFFRKRAESALGCSPGAFGKRGTSNHQRSFG